MGTNTIHGMVWSDCGVDLVALVGAAGGPVVADVVEGGEAAVAAHDVRRVHPRLRVHTRQWNSGVLWHLLYEVLLEAGAAVVPGAGGHDVRGVGEVAAEGRVGHLRGVPVHPLLLVAAVVALPALWWEAGIIKPPRWFGDQVTR